MKSDLSAVERFRMTGGPMGTQEGDRFGAFTVPGPLNERLSVIVGDEGYCGWDHVSVSTKRRTPTWEEMCFIKSLFFEPEETVVQFHPAESEYVNVHPFCLHLWRHVEGHKLPPRMMV